MTPQQTRKLRARLNPKHVRTRQLNGFRLRYLEGWYVVAEANRIFGFDGWDRETIETNCIFARANNHEFIAAYTARIRIRVHTETRIVIREGSGSGEAKAATAGQAHEIALKAAETDATKRALLTFGNAFGLSLYQQDSSREKKQPAPQDKPPSNSANGTSRNQSAASSSPQTPSKTGIDKSKLTLGVPIRNRDKRHLKFVACHPCLICGRNRSQAHHLTFAQPKGMSVKVSDEFTVPLCPIHHRELHQHGDEKKWWAVQGVEPTKIAKELWDESNSRFDRKIESA